MGTKTIWNSLAGKNKLQIIHILILLDLSSAFDTANHQNILSALSGITATVNSSVGIDPAVIIIIITIFIFFSPFNNVLSFLHLIDFEDSKDVCFMAFSPIRMGLFGEVG